MNNWTDRIRLAMLKQGFDETMVSILSGIDKEKIILFLDGIFEPNEKEYVSLAKVLQVPKTWLSGEDTTIEAIEYNGNLAIPDISKIRYVPLYESVSAGLGTLANEDVIDYIPLMIKSDFEAKETFCIRVKGDSMFPYIREGDVLQVHKQDTVDSGAIAVVHVEGVEIEGFVKKIVYKEDWLELRSFNTSYQTKRFERKEREQVKPIGIVKKIIRDVPIGVL